MPNFDAPIPGQSLTDTPGNHPWEKPPRFAKIDEALDTLFDKLMEPEKTAEMLALLDAGVPAKSLTEATLFSGFANGQWTPDLAILMAKPVYAMIHAIGERAGVKVVSKFDTKDSKLKDMMEQLAETQGMEDTGPLPDERIGAPATGTDREISRNASGEALGQFKEQQMPATGLMGMVK